MPRRSLSHPASTAPASRITAGELVLVCSRYDLGAIRSLRRIRGGSRESPKVLVVSDRGRYLIKRRSPRIGVGGRRDDLVLRVELAHEVQAHLAAQGFPIAQVVSTRDMGDGARSLLELNGSIYEVFRFVEGERYNRTAPAARAAGRLLATAHRLLADLRTRTTPPGLETTYHNHAAVAPSIDDLAARETDRRVRDDLLALRAAYLRAAGEAERLSDWSRTGSAAQLIHADWHPGNLLFAASPGATAANPSGTFPAETAPLGGGGAGSSGGWGGGGGGGGGGADDPRIVAVLDFDSVRLGRPLLDFANGALQFAVARRPGSVAGGGERGAGETGQSSSGVGIRMSLNADLFRAFVAGYLAHGGRICVRSTDLPVIPWLMIEAIVVETVAPIVATGQFGKVSAAAALAMTRQAVDWMAIEAGTLVSLATGH